MKPRRRHTGWSALLALLGLATGLGLMWGVWPASVESKPPPPSGPWPVPKTPKGRLSGLVVYLSAGHGYKLHRSLIDGHAISWGQQRIRTNGILEDEWTANYVADVLAPALEAAGATVIALRERDRHSFGVVADDGTPSFAATGLEHRVSDPLALDGSYARLWPHGGAAWWLRAPEAGHYYVYARWASAPDLDERAVFTVQTPSATRDIVVDQTVHGGHWWPLGDDCLFEGDDVMVYLHGSGGPVAADAVRLGGGNYTIVAPDRRVRDHPFFEVSFPPQVFHLGAPANFDEYATSGEPISDQRLRPFWASWASPSGEDAVYLSIHTNAAPRRGRAQGLIVFAGVDNDPPTPAHPGSVRLANHVERELVAAVRVNDRKYKTRGVKPGNFSEISPLRNALPGVLIELGFHTSRKDARRLQKPQYQRDATKGIIEAFSKWY
ncbi:MAG: N-acetylmuramoyl-L-alanine amidase, partial [Myxococcota bacterium]